MNATKILTLPIGCIVWYVHLPYTYHQNQQNVGKFTIHASLGLYTILCFHAAGCHHWSCLLLQPGMRHTLYFNDTLLFVAVF